MSSKHEEVSIAFLPSNIMMITTFNRSLWSNHAYFRRWEIFLYGIYSLKWKFACNAQFQRCWFIRLLFNCWLMTFVNQLKSYSDIVFRAQLKEQCKSSPDFVCNLQFYMTLFFYNTYINARFRISQTMQSRRKIKQSNGKGKATTRKNAALGIRRSILRIIMYIVHNQAFCVHGRMKTNWMSIL